MRLGLVILSVLSLVLAQSLADEKAINAVEAIEAIEAIEAVEGAEGCPCAQRPAPYVAPKPKPETQRYPRRHHRKHSSSSSCSSSSSSSSDCGCTPKPPYPMPPRNRCPSSSSSSSSSSCSRRFPTHCPNAQALEIVRALDKQFVDAINQGDLTAALAMVHPDATFHKLDEVANPVPFGPICEESSGSIPQLITQFTSDCYSTWLIDYYRCARVKSDYSVAITAVEISYVNRDILAAANDVVRVWKPTYGCNFKLANWDLSNLVCKPQVVRDVLDL